MRLFLCSLATALLLIAQAPPPRITPETVVAKTGDGKDITVADVQKMLAETPPVVYQTMMRDPAAALTAVFLEQSMAEQAEKLKLGEKSPWKEQIEVARENILGTAMMRQVEDSYEVTPEQTEAYYQQHINEYQQANIKAIKINFKPEAKSSANDLEAAARQALEAAHATTDRAEAEAKKIAEDVVKQARGGADFAGLVAKYAEAESKDFNGDFPPVKQNSMYPAEIKKTVFAMKAGEVSDPIRQSNCFYVIRLTDITAQPLNDVRETIIHNIRTVHGQQYVEQLRVHFKTQIVRPDYFYQLGATGQKK